LDKSNDWRELKTMVRALADVVRLTIVYHLARRQEMTVTALTELLAISQPLVSWHLRKLQRAGLARTRRAGRQVYCSLDRERFQDCLRCLEQLVDPGVVLATLPIGSALLPQEALEVNVED
jgi:DNA-binding transcriptional ArsR family regulator